MQTSCAARSASRRCRSSRSARSEPDSGADRPGEARERGRRSEAAGAEAPPHEQRGRAASLASRRRAGPRPSRCHRVDSPTTSRPASRLASSMPSSPGGVSSGSAEMPSTRWTASAPCESSRLASRLPCSGTAAAPASRSGACVGAREPRAELDRRPVVLGPSEGDENGALAASRPEERAAPRRRAPPQARRSAARRELPRPGARRGRPRAGARRRARSRAEPAPHPAPST